MEKNPVLLNKQLNVSSVTNDTLSLFLIINTHEGPKKIESFDNHMENLKTDKIYNPSESTFKIFLK